MQNFLKLEENGRNAVHLPNGRPFGFRPPFPNSQVGAMVLGITTVVCWYVLCLPGAPASWKSWLEPTYAVLLALQIIAWVRVSTKRIGATMARENPKDLEMQERPPKERQSRSSELPPAVHHDINYCKYCHAWKPSRPSKHCKLCKVCVEDFDHHCEYLNICIFSIPVSVS